jgi:hypothetical protein
MRYDPISIAVGAIVLIILIIVLFKLLDGNL